MTADRVASVARRLGGALTRRGWGLVLAGGGCVLVGHLLGVQELYGVAGAILAAVAGAVVWTLATRWRIHVERRLQPPRVSAGEPSSVDLMLRNVDGRISPILRLRDPFDGGRGGADLLVAPMEPRRVEVCRYQIPGSRRGSYTIGPLTLEVSDPFGLARKSVVALAAEGLLVHPAIERLGFPVVAAGSDRHGGGPIPRRGGDNDEFAGLREYRPGDDMRRVHWASSARSDTLLVRDLQGEHRGRLVLVLDLRDTMWSGPSLEVAVGAAASLAENALSSHLQVRLLTTAGVDSGIGSGARHRSHILDELAIATPHRWDLLRMGSGIQLPSAPTARLARAQRSPGRLVGNDRTIVISSDRAGPSDLRLINGLASRGPLTLVVIERGGRSSRQRRERAGTALPARVVRVAMSETFASAWDQAGVS